VPRLHITCEGGGAKMAIRKAGLPMRIEIAVMGMKFLQNWEISILLSQAASAKLRNTDT